MGADGEDATEVGGGSGCLRKALSRINTDGAVVSVREVGVIGTNGTEVIWSSCGVPETGDEVEGKNTEKQFVAESGDKQSTSGSGGTTALYLLGQEAGGSGAISGSMAYLLCMRKGDEIKGRG